jgi:hypothetical protein
VLLEEQMLRVKPQAVSAPDELPGRGREELAAGRQRPWALALRGAAAHSWGELHVNSWLIAGPRDSQDAPEAPVAVWLEAQPGPSG